MKPTLALAASFLLLASCATLETSVTAAPRSLAAASGSTYYCWKDRLATEGDNLVCNWEASASDACLSTGVVSIANHNVARGPENTRRCENGQWLVVVTTK
jgi:hypothetical protein